MEEQECNKERRLNLMVPAELHKKLRIRTVIEGRNMSLVVTDALNSYLENVNVQRDDNNEQ